MINEEFNKVNWENFKTAILDKESVLSVNFFFNLKILIYFTKKK